MATTIERTNLFICAVIFLLSHRHTHVYNTFVLPFSARRALMKSVLVYFLLYRHLQMPLYNLACKTKVVTKRRELYFPKNHQFSFHSNSMISEIKMAARVLRFDW